MRTALWIVSVLTLTLAAVDAASIDRGHPHGDLAVECSACHTTESWSPLASPLLFRHDETGFALSGAHAAAGCRQCHTSLVFAFVATACRDCHTDAHAGELGAACESCHEPTVGWENRRQVFDAHGSSLFPLLAAHAMLDCDACHEGQRPFEYATTPLDCAGCHLSTYQATANPNHARAGFSTDCESCHGMAARSWQTTAFQHPATFPLAGAHLAAGCDACHPANGAGTPTACIACHSGDFQAARNPDHAGGGFSTECQICHTDRGWVPATFRHELTAFPLQGAHQPLDCSECHSGGFAGTPSDCVACHRADYNATRDPRHAAAGFPTSCNTCHSQAAWTPATGIDHNQTRFPLQGAHRQLDCSACHSGGFSGTPTDCVACHRADYDATRDPQHAAAGFPTTCDTCHSQGAWRPATSIDHNLTRFPLQGAHRQLDCSACHSGGFSGTPTDCVACHRADYDATRDPQHAAAGFPTTCETCHSQAAWTPASGIDHNLTRFPLTGAHRNLGCSACHSGGFSGTPTDCVACHRADYDAATDPNHRAAGFPTTCETCHNTTRWDQSSWNHDALFPINSGEHRGAWSACSDCHVNPSSFAVFECTVCHEHRRSEMDAEHRGVGGYQYVSQACFNCHPRGRE